MVLGKLTQTGLFRRLTERIGEAVAEALARPWARPLARMTGQFRGVMLLRDATGALEVDDYRAAEALFVRVLGMDATRTTRMMAYHGAVISRLRLGQYGAAVQLIDDAFVLLLARGGRDQLSADDRVAYDALADARKFGRWALAHPQAAEDLRRRERQERVAPRPDGGGLPEVEAAPLGQSTQWPDPLQSGYRVAVHGLLAAGLVAAAADRLVGAHKLLRTALYVSRFDHRIERDVCWHLSRVDEELGLREEADRHRARYEQLNERVKQTLRRLRWTN